MENLGISPGMGDMKPEGGLCAASPPGAGTAGLPGGLLLAGPWALEMIRGQEGRTRAWPGELEKEDLYFGFVLFKQLEAQGHTRT